MSRGECLRQDARTWIEHEGVRREIYIHPELNKSYTYTLYIDICAYIYIYV